MSQCVRLVTMCCGIVGSPDLMHDTLLQAASSRTIAVILDPTSWKQIGADDVPLLLLERLSQMPVLFQAFVRCLSCVNDLPNGTRRHSNFYC